MSFFFRSCHAENDGGRQGKYYMRHLVTGARFNYLDSSHDSVLMSCFLMRVSALMALCKLPSLPKKCRLVLQVPHMFEILMRASRDNRSVNFRQVFKTLAPYYGCTGGIVMDTFTCPEE